jgi:hypothetical protein
MLILDNYSEFKKSDRKIGNMFKDYISKIILLKEKAISELLSVCSVLVTSGTHFTFVSVPSLSKVDRE